MKLFMLLLALSFGTAMAQSVGPQDVEPMLQQMQASGKISAQQAEVTRKYMQKMNDQQWADIQRRAETCIARNPALAAKFEEGGVNALSVHDCNLPVDQNIHKVQPEKPAQLK